MPTALRESPYRFFFVSFDCNEPTCGHVRRDDSGAKIWLEPIEVAFNHGFPGHELRDIEEIIVEHHSQLTEAWYEHCGRGRSHRRVSLPGSVRANLGCGSLRGGNYV
ncbi:DUF4160 domain-containing protein [Salinibacter ruber]|uniref:DUF4160 domain-containing protein n=1 Tax=Salinibacter ruber TaxID=146919 RepID=UPI00161A3061